MKVPPLSHQTLYKSFSVFRFMRDVLGVGLLLVSLSMGAAFWDYNPLDPSWNTAIDAEVMNFLGVAGAVFADTFSQLWGVSTYLVIFCAARLGIFFLLGTKKISFIRGVWYVFLTLVCVSASSAALESWGSFLGGHKGGMLGYMLVHQIHAFLLAWSINVSLNLMGVVYGSVAAITFYGLLGISWHQWKALFILSQKIRIGIVKGRDILRKPFFSSAKSVYGKEASLRVSGGGFFKKTPPSFEPSFAKDRKDFSGASEEWGSEPKRVSKKENSKDIEFYSGLEEDTEGEKVSSRAKNQVKASALIELTKEAEYAMPPLDLLRSHEKILKKVERMSEADIQSRARQLESVLEEFGVRGQIQRVRPGPIVTLFELTPAPGIKSSRIVGLSDDIARSMSAISARVAVIPGHNAIGIELPNENKETVYLRALLETDAFERTASRLALALGKDIGGAPVVVDLARMPHLLVAGTTGSGKSVAINTMILSLLFRLSPQQCKFIMIDPKMLELSIYEGIPHLLAPVVTEPKKAIVALKWVVREMEERYRLMAKLGVRNIDGYNQRLTEAMENSETLTRRVQVGFDAETGMPLFEEQPLEKTLLPYIVVVVDEMADLMLVAGKEIEAAIQRLAQMARAAGIHIIMATQRPSVDVITGTIKANFPTRISFQVTSKIDSRTILGEQGAEQLLGHGDMLYMAPGGRLSRVHGPFVQDHEVEKVVSFLKSQGEPVYIEEITYEEEASTSETKASAEDPLYAQAVSLVLREKKASTSFIQRHLQIGYNRAARLVDLMEKEGVISAANHVGKRDVFGS